MLEFFNIKRDIPFMSYARVTTIISLVTFILAVAALGIKGLNFGVDFTGGTVMELSYPQVADIHKIRTTLEKAGYSDASVQNFGTSHDVLVRLPVKQGLTGAKLSEQIFQALQGADSTVNENSHWKKAKKPRMITTSCMLAMIAATEKRHSKRIAR